MSLQALVKQQEQSIPGFKLVAHYEKWFPVYCLDCRVAVRDAGEMSLVSVFVLKLVNEKISGEADLADFLGISLFEAQKALHELTLLGYVIPVQSMSGRFFKISDDGLGMLELKRVVHTKEEAFTLKMDAISGELQHMFSMDSFNVTEDPGDLAVRAFLPYPDKFTLAGCHHEVKLLYQDYQGMFRKRTASEYDDILDLSAYTQYRKLYLLVFQSEEGAFRFQVFNRQYYMPEYEKPLLQMIENGLDLWQMDPIEMIESHDAKETAIFPELEELIGQKPGTVFEEPLPTASGQGSIYPLTTSDHFVKLQQALQQGKNEVIIISPWVTNEVIQDIEEDMQRFLQRGGTLWIGYGYPRDVDHKREKTEKTVKSLQKRLNSSRFHPVRLGDTHEKILICDNDFVVIGSYNWLSFRGDRTRGFTSETSICLEVQDVVLEVKQRVMRRLDSRRKK